ncbi:ArsR/SmtB family transcription factor [Actinophytocola sp.]|uniref:ArsR/SmtB family transcription factor n=1 Tax=Actinophytocola sp. TaxID=1872138 RepID=UPI0038998D5E
MVKERRRITDPKALRALAHPLRWKLIEFLGREGTATATQCAEETGESVANCSYHLNLLAKYDYVERAEGGQGREKPWQLVHQGQSITDMGVDEETRLAAQAASAAFLDHAFTQIRERFLASHLLPEDWRAVLGTNTSTDFLTLDELEELHEMVTAFNDRFKERRYNPELRPEGAQPVYVFLSTSIPPETA